MYKKRVQTCCDAKVHYNFLYASKTIYDYSILKLKNSIDLTSRTLRWRENTDQLNIKALIL